MVYEGEQEGPIRVAQNIVDKAIRNLFVQYFPNPSKPKKKKSQQEESTIYRTVQQYFGQGNSIDILTDASDKQYTDALNRVPGLKELVANKVNGISKTDIPVWMEFVLHGMAAYSLLSKFQLEEGNKFSDITSSVFNFSKEDEMDDDLKELFK
jgi:magnesium chelatase subunit I